MTFNDLPEEEQGKILEHALLAANKEQRDMVKRLYPHQQEIYDDSEK